MKRTATIASVLILLCSVSLVASPRKFFRHDTAVPNQYLVSLLEIDEAAIPGLARSIAAAYRGRVLETYPSALHGALIEMTAAAAEAMSDDPRVRFVEANGIFEGHQPKAISASQITQYNGNYLWFLDRLDDRTFANNNTYNYCTTGNQLPIYILDIGVDINHPEIAGRTSANIDFTGQAGFNATNPCHNEPNGWHGTAVAALAAGTNVGTAKGARIVPLKVGTCRGALTQSHYISAMQWLNSPYRSRGIVNFSGGDLPLAGSAPSMEYSTSQTVAAGFPVFTSADNYVTNACRFSPNRIAYGGGGATVNNDQGQPVPIDQQIMAIGATNLGGDSTTWNVDFRYQLYPNGIPGLYQDQGSNSGPCVSMWAPGAFIYTAHHSYTDNTGYHPPDYVVGSGTSLASPLAAGIAARYMKHVQDTQWRSPTPAEVSNILYNAGTKNVVRNGATEYVVRNTQTYNHYKCWGNYYPVQGHFTSGLCPTIQGVTITEEIQPSVSSTAPFLYWNDGACGSQSW